jgi:hypothetical protein
MFPPTSRSRKYLTFLTSVGPAFPVLANTELLNTFPMRPPSTISFILRIMGEKDPWIPTIVLALCVWARVDISWATERFRSRGHSTNMLFPAMMLGFTVKKACRRGRYRRLCRHQDHWQALFNVNNMKFGNDSRREDEQTFGFHIRFRGRWKFVAINGCLC